MAKITNYFFSSYWKNFRLLLCAFIFIFNAYSAQKLFSVDVTWIGPDTGGDWNTGANWSSGAPKNSSNGVLITKTTDASTVFTMNMENTPCEADGYSIAPFFCDGISSSGQSVIWRDPVDSCGGQLLSVDDWLSYGCLEPYECAASDNQAQFHFLRASVAAL